MDKYKEGTVFELYEDDESQYVVLKNVEIDDSIYLLISQLYGARNNYGINPNQIILINVDKKTDEIAFVNNKDIIRQVVDVALSN